MIRQQLGAYRERVRSALIAAFQESHTPHQIGLSFAIGIFITALPTLGTGLGVFVLLAYAFSWINKVALFSSVVVLNPIVKPLVYLASYRIGSVLFSPEPVILFDITFIDAAINIMRRLLIGNLIIAFALAVGGYFVVRRLTIEYRDRDIEIIEVVLEEPRTEER